MMDPFFAVQPATGMRLTFFSQFSGCFLLEKVGMKAQHAPLFGCIGFKFCVFVVSKGPFVLFDVQNCLLNGFQCWILVVV